MELKAYEKLSLYFYYKGQMEIAQSLHNKFVNNFYESNESYIKSIGINFYSFKINKYLLNKLHWKFDLSEENY